MSFDTIITKVLRFEGGLVLDPNDPGGLTNMGISQRAYPKEYILGMTAERAKEIYKRDYWNPAKCVLLPEALQGIHLDTAINCGVSRAAKILQEAAHVTVDGMIGPKTIDAAQGVTVKDYAAARLAWNDKAIAANPRLAKFRKGWTTRVMSWT